MSSLPVEAPKFSPFLLFLPQTPSQKNLILVPSPLAITTSSYRTLYRSVHASPEFFMMGFGPSWPPKNWSDKETEAWMRRCDVDKSWGPRGMGDFAIGLLPGKIENSGREGGASGLRILKEGEWESFMEARGGEGPFLEGLEYVGYAGIRDATTTSLVSVGRPETFPGYLEMIELRYGIAPEYWGRGLARTAAEGVMEWVSLSGGLDAARFSDQGRGKKPGKA
ncbi:hypothetical protein HYALB_00011275 [Hymenoscyphus albidus]|uniref:N-acetyltransferase domain-containing protein n=1 Tax=Hymenoscyphus albidus TaxID=595503 RepID=A0A9N9LYP5_9HELO|nr:hypothetical protein HYALB_00011275 [Hymenoscyphus albidus]